MKITLLCMILALTRSVYSLLTVTFVDAQITPALGLQKRAREVIVNKDYKKLQALKNGEPTTTEAPPKPWVRTIYEDKVEIVTPIIIAGVTISAKPPATTDGLEPWVSLNADGSPKTINPKMKNGVIKDKSPDYSTWFQEIKTMTYSKEELRAHNMKDDEIFVEETFVSEDLTYRLLNPIIRCTPNLYEKKGMAKDRSPEPFCFPRDNSRLYMEKSYFITWYYPFFEKGVEKVRLHLSYVKESLHQKGMKRDLSETYDSESRQDFEKRSSVMEKGGQISKSSFFVSDWLLKEEGILPITVDPEWFGEKDYYHKVLISLQPDTVPDDEFERLDNYVVVEIAKKAKVAKGSLLDLKEQDELREMKALYGEDADMEEGINTEMYMAIITLPSCVLVAVILMYFLVLYNKKQIDLSFLREVKFNKKKRSGHKRAHYTELPQWQGQKKD